jgi:ABC-type amino acid transport substrate-binding protein
MGVRADEGEVTQRSCFGLLALSAVLMVAMPSRADDTLMVCLQEDIPLNSLRKTNGASGFDVAIAEAVARNLGRQLAIQWFEIKGDNSVTLDANTLLSDGRCDLVGGYPLTRGSLGKPQLGIARMADFAGAKAADRRRKVALGELVATRPYYRATLAIIVNGETVKKPIAGLADLKGLRIVAETGTLGDAVLMTYRDGMLIDDINHFVAQRGRILERIEAGEYDAALVSLRRLDAHRAANPATRLKATGYFHRVGPNMGFVGLVEKTDLIEDVSRAIAEMAEKGELKALAEASGLTYVPPREPFVSDNVSMADLAEM